MDHQPGNGWMMKVIVGVLTVVVAAAYLNQIAANKEVTKQIGVLQTEIGNLKDLIKDWRADLRDKIKTQDGDHSEFRARLRDLEKRVQ